MTLVCGFTAFDPCTCGKPWWEHWEMSPGHRWRVRPELPYEVHEAISEETRGTMQMFSGGMSADDIIEGW